MKVGHIALWTKDIEAQVAFWSTYFHGKVGDAYISQNRPGFISRFVTFEAGPTIELMTFTELGAGSPGQEHIGWAHLAMVVGSQADVDRLARQAEQDGILKAKPRMTGDGFYEAIVFDPDGNLIEMIANEQE